MKTKEFIKSVEALGFQTHVREKEIKVCDEMRGYGIGDPMFILTSDLVEVHIPGDFYISSFERLGVLKLVVEYLDTPLTEREEEKRYRLITTSPLLRKELSYLNRIRIAGIYTLNTKDDTANNQTIFTESEIAEMDTTGFEKVEVTE